MIRRFLLRETNQKFDSLQQQIIDLRKDKREDQDHPPFPFFSNTSFDNKNKFSTKRMV